jgi:hypothetical protein
MAHVTSANYAAAARAIPTVAAPAAARPTTTGQALAPVIPPKDTRLKTTVSFECRNFDIEILNRDLMLNVFSGCDCNEGQQF